MFVASIPVDIFIVYSIVNLLYFERKNQCRPVVLTSLASETFFEGTCITDFLCSEIIHDVAGITVCKDNVFSYTIHHLVVIFETGVRLSDIVNGIGIAVGHDVRRYDVKTCEVEGQRIFRHGELGIRRFYGIELSITLPHANGMRWSERNRRTGW